MNIAVAYVCDAVRTPFASIDGALATVRPDDLGAVPIQALAKRNRDLDLAAVDDVIYGCASQAGEDRQNVARMAALLAGLPETVAGMTVNRWCGSGLEAIAVAARAIRLREGALFVAGGVESMSRAPFVMPKMDVVQVAGAKLADTASGWRFVNPLIHERFGTDSAANLAEKVAAEFQISRDDQDAFAFRSQQRAAHALKSAAFLDAITPVIARRRSVKMLVGRDEQPLAEVSMGTLAKLKPIARNGRTVTDGNTAAVGDGACALLLASHAAAKRFKLTPRARVVAMAVEGGEPQRTGSGPVGATRRVLERAGLKLSQVELIELNEVSAAEALAALRELGLPDDAPFVNPNGGAIALGHPVGASSARLVMSAVCELAQVGSRYALCTTSAGMGQGAAMLLERV